METSQRPLQILASLDCKARTLHPGLLSLVEERLHALAPASADPSSAAELLGLLAAVLHNACSGRVAEDYADGPEDAMQDCVRLAGTIVSWMTQGVVTAVASSSPDNCSSLKDFVAAALELASHAFFSQEYVVTVLGCRVLPGWLTGSKCMSPRQPLGLEACSCLLYECKTCSCYMPSLNHKLSFIKLMKFGSPQAILTHIS